MIMIIMIRKSIFSLLFGLGLLTLLVACSKDDDNDSGVAELTEAEIVELLQGEWDVHGEIKFHPASGANFEDNYKGNIKFMENNKFRFKVTEGNEYKNWGYLEEIFVDDQYRYTLLKKNGRRYIVFVSRQEPYEFEFEIVLLKANRFRLVYDQDVSREGKHLGSLYMSIISN